VKKYNITINEVEAENAQNPNSNVSQTEERKRRIETYIRILRVLDAIVFLAIAVLTLFAEDFLGSTTFKMPSLKILKFEKP